MKRLTVWLGVPAVLCVMLCSCGKQGPPRKETYPVTGEVYVDGQPAGSLAVRCVDVNGIDKEAPTTSSAFTDESGKFEIATYESADGVPEGEYVLTFQWGEWDLITRAYSGDKLNKRYQDPKKSEHRFTVVKGQPTDLGRFELTTE